MLMKLANGTEIVIDRVQCNFSNSFSKLSNDSVNIPKEEVQRLGLEQLNQELNDENIAKIQFICENQDVVERSYRYIARKQYILSDTVNMFTLTLSEEARPEMGGEYYGI